jgi:hypothetical protein
MGASLSGLPQSLRIVLTEEFRRVKRDPEREYLVFEEILLLRSPPGLFLNFDHFATLYVLSSNCKGKVRLDDLLQLAAFCTTHQKNYPTYELHSQMQGFFMMIFWRDARESPARITEWLLALIHNNSPSMVLAGDVECVSSEALFPLFSVLRLFLPLQQGFQEMFDGLQVAAEEQDLLDLGNADADDYVPLLIVEFFCNRVVEGILNLTASLGFAEHHAEALRPPPPHLLTKATTIDNYTTSIPDTLTSSRSPGQPPIPEPTMSEFARFISNPSIRHSLGQLINPQTTTPASSTTTTLTILRPATLPDPWEKTETQIPIVELESGGSSICENGGMSSSEAKRSSVDEDEKTETGSCPLQFTNVETSPEAEPRRNRSRKLEQAIAAAKERKNEENAPAVAEVCLEKDTAKNILLDTNRVVDAQAEKNAREKPLNAVVFEAQRLVGDRGIINSKYLEEENMLERGEMLGVFVADAKRVTRLETEIVCAEATGAASNYENDENDDNDDDDDAKVRTVMGC